MADWREIRDSAIRETDRTRLKKIIYDAEQALFVRGLEMDGIPSLESERAEMAEVAEALLNLKTHKLGWPNPVDTVSS
jgi:hypothetical protein